MESGISLNCLMVVRGSIVNGPLRPNVTQMAILNYIRLNLLPKGFTQKGSVDYNETFSPISKRKKKKTLLQLT